MYCNALNQHFVCHEVAMTWALQVRAQEYDERHADDTR